MSLRFQTVLALALLGSLTLEAARAQSPPSPSSQNPPASPAPRAKALTTEELQLLSMPSVREALKLSKPQSDKLQQLTDQYYQEQQQMLSELEKTAAGQREQKLTQLRKQATQRLEQVGQQAGLLLTAEQQNQIQQIHWQMTVYANLATAGVVEQLRLSPQQQQQLQQIYEQTQDQIWKLQHQAAQQVVQLLTPQQQEQLKSLQSTATAPSGARR